MGLKFWPPPLWISIATGLFVVLAILLCVREKETNNEPSELEEPELYCPKCGDAYRPGFFTCADCGVALVKTPPQPTPEDGPEYVDMVEVYSTSDINKITFVQSLLGGSGIKFVSQGQTYGRRRMPSHILVPSDQADDARALIEEFEKSNPS